SYDNVLAVGGTDSLKVLGPDQTFSLKMDICAPSVAVISTIQNASQYGPRQGSSFATPQVSGAAALVRSKWPNLTAQQVAEQVRITADQSIYSLPGNQPFPEMLGRGFLDMYAALTDTLSPSVRNISKNIDDQKAIYSGETVVVSGDFRNFLRPVTSVTVTLTTTSPHVTITDNTSELGAIGTLATVNSVNDPFTFVVSSTAPANEIVRFRLGYSGPGYTDYQYFDVVVNPDYITLDANQLDVTLSARGTIGYNGRNTSQGVGVSFNGGPSLLYEGGVIVGSSSTRVSDVVRSQPMITNQHFLRTEAMHYIAGTMATQQATGLMQDTAANAYRAGVEIRTNGYANAQPPHDKYVIVEYIVKNITPDPINDLYLGIFADWDLNMASLNAADWDGSRSLGYVYSFTPNQPHAGIALLTAHDPSYYAINNYAGTGPVGPSEPRGLHPAPPGGGGPAAR
ncbi:MAG: serine protease, partial [Sphingobacteriales bacterium]